MLRKEYGGNHYESVTYKTGSIDGTSRNQNTPADIWVRISTDGFEYSWNGTDFNVAEHASFDNIKNLGKASPLYVGTYANETSAYFYYFKITSGSVPVSVSGVALDHSSETLHIGDNLDLTATISPANASNKKVGWISSNTSVATVSSTGVVTAVGAGNATISVITQDGEYQADCDITVPAPINVSSVSLDKSAATLYMGKTLTLVATVNPNDADDMTISWSSSDESVATVSNGVVSPVAVGEATITVTTTDGGKTASCVVTVSEPLGVYYLDALGNTSNTPVAFNVEGTGFCIELSKSEDLNLSAGDELEISFRHNQLDSFFLCLGDKTAFGSGTWHLDWVGFYVNAYTWFVFRNTNNKELASSSSRDGGVRISADAFQWYDAINSEWKDCTETDPEEGYSLSMLKSLDTLCIGTGKDLTFNEDTKTVINYIKITKAPTKAGGLKSSSAGAVSTGTVTTW